MMKKLITFVACGYFILSPTGVWSATTNGEITKAAEGLLLRRVPALVGKVGFRVIPSDEGQDVFEMQTVEGKLVISGNNGIALASGLNWFLKYYCNCQITFRTEQLNLPSPLPSLTKTVRISSPYKYRYYFNYTAFSYTMAWWDWKEWEKMIDLMAMYGVNAPLSITGQEGVWRNVAKRLGFSEAQMQKFYAGPGYLAFGWLGCLDGWAGPLSGAWIDEHVALEQKILARERALGMTPILQGFTGHVPNSFPEVFPAVKLVKLSEWNSFPSTYLVDPSEPAFVKVGNVFIEEQTKLFGTDHLYASDPFIETTPPSNDPEFLRKVGASVYESMRAVDPQAVWVLQSWAFCVVFPQFWKEPQTKAFFTSIPPGRFLILDLMCEASPSWEPLKAFYGQPWIWCVVHSFGGELGLHAGAMNAMCQDLQKARSQKGKESGQFSGLGFIMEGLSWNPIMDDFQGDMVWRQTAPDLKEWTAQFAERRYGVHTQRTQKAWQELLQTVYLPRSGRVDNMIVAKPAFGKAHCAVSKTVERAYVPVLRALLDCADEVGNQRTYQFDLVQLTRQTIGSLSTLYFYDMLLAYQNRDRQALRVAADKLDILICDMDRLLSADPQFLLGPWLEGAKRWGRTGPERRLYEWNARNIITQWGEKDSPLFDYATRQWGGMLRDNYAPRWRLFYQELDRSIRDNVLWSDAEFDKKVREWQDAWTKKVQSYPTEASGENPVTIAKWLYEKYSGDFQRDLPRVNYPLQDYPPVVSLTTGRLASASASLPNHSAHLANDGIRNVPDSYWAYDTPAEKKAASIKEDIWWMVDLEQLTPVGRVNVVCYYLDFGFYSFWVEGSVDGKDWSLLSDQRHNIKQSTIKGYETVFSPQTVRYLRVKYAHDSANEGFRLIEVMAYDK